jgi:hypothetical protein
MKRLSYFISYSWQPLAKKGPVDLRLNPGQQLNRKTEYEDDHGKDDICKHYQLSAFFITCRKSW